MHKIKLACFAALLTVGMAHAASTPCNGFEIKIKNNTPDDLLANKIELSGAEIQPGGMQKLSAHSEQVFTVNKSIDDAKMAGTLEFHSISLPSKKVSIEFDLKNKDLVCYHDDKVRVGDYEIDKTRLPGSVTYTIG